MLYLINTYDVSTNVKKYVNSAKLNPAIYQKNNSFSIYPRNVNMNHHYSSINIINHNQEILY